MSQGSPAVAGPAQVERVGAGVRDLLRGRLSDFRLERCGRGVVLRGTARSYHAKQLAQHAVMKGIDLPIVRNEIVVT